MKSVRRMFILSGIIALISLAVGAFLMFLGPDHIEISAKNLPELLGDEDLLPIIIVPASLLIMGVVMIPFLKVMFPGEIKNAVTAKARVIKVWDTGVSINDNPQVGLQLEVTPPTGSPFEVEAKTVVSRLNAALVQPGTTADIKYDPLKPQRVQVVTLHVDSPASGGSAARMLELNELREKDLITGDEYRKKREEILKNL
jgi:hypothetical protein